MSNQLVIKQIEKICKGDMNVFNSLDKTHINFFIEASRFCIEKKRGNQELAQKIISYYDDLSCFRGLNWVGNSCYIDSVLVSLLSVPSAFVTDYILDVDLATKPLNGTFLRCGKTKDEDLKNRKILQDSLNNIANSIHGTGPYVDFCTDFRQTLKICKNTENFHGTGMADAGEFLTYLFDKFPVEVATKKRITYGSTNLTNKNVIENELIFVNEFIDNKASPIYFVDNDQVLAIPKQCININSFLSPVKIDSGELEETERWTPDKEKPEISYLRRISIDTLEDTPFLVFNVARMIAADRGRFNQASIFPDEQIQIKNKTFILTAVTMYTGARHYVAIIKCLNIWYYYDDYGEDGYKIKNLGASIKNAIANSPYNPVTNGTLYFYTLLPSRKRLKLLPPTKLVRDLSIYPVFNYQNEMTREIYEIIKDKTQYYVTLDEGAFFQMEDNKCPCVISTAGLAGCVAIGLCIKYYDNDYVFLNHIPIDYIYNGDTTDTESKLDRLFDKIRTVIINDVPSFNFDKTYNTLDYKSRLFVMFPDILGVTRSTALGNQILESLKNKLPYTNRVINFIATNNVAIVSMSTGITVFTLPTDMILPDKSSCSRKYGYGNTRYRR